jgi:hypothetical protein
MPCAVAFLTSIFRSEEDDEGVKFNILIFIYRRLIPPLSLFWLASNDFST